MVKHQFIEGMKSSSIHKKLIGKPQFSLQEALLFAKTESATQEQLKILRNEETAPPSETVNQIQNKPKTLRPLRSCGRCGLSHDLNNCRAKNSTCYLCGKTGHFARLCKGRRQPNPQYNGGRPRYDFQKNRFQRENINSNGQPRNRVARQHKQYSPERNQNNHSTMLVEHNNSSEEDVFCVNEVSHPTSLITSFIGGVEVTAMIDSGCHYNLINESNWEIMKSKGVRISNMSKNSDKTFNGYGGNRLEVLSMFTASIQVRDTKLMAKFYVIKGEGKILIGKKTAINLNILRLGTDVNLVANTRFPKIKGVIIDIPMKSHIKPVIQPYRRVPVALEKLVNEKITNLLDMGIIEKVNKPSKWVSPLVVVPKHNSSEIRICVDMRRANEAVMRENHPLPTIENFLPHFSKAKIFSKLDIKNAFHQIEISPESREITTFITSRGLFRYTRLMFGINCAPELFQKIMEQILSGCKGCLNYIDDIIIFGNSKEQHDKRLKIVHDRLRKHEILLNHDKCEYGKTMIKFLGQKLSEKGIQPDEDKLSDIKKFRSPQTTEETRSFLGLVNYVGKFIPNLATLTDPLRELTRCSARFLWTKEKEIAFKKIKEELTQPRILGYYDIDDRTQIIADASPVGLGGVLIQIDKSNNSRVIAFASKSLSAVERRYAQTEKEALALVWAVERFHYYIYGRTFDLITDHKPL